MPFHPGGHKLRPQPKRGITTGDRLMVTLFGCLLIFKGGFGLQRGFLLSWLQVPVYSYGFVFAGVIAILFAWIPTRWSDPVFRRAARDKVKAARSAKD